MEIEIGKTFKKQLLKLLHKFYRFDEFLSDFIDAIKLFIDDLSRTIIFLWTLLHFNWLDDDGCEWWAKLLDLKLSNNMSLNEKRALIRAKWRATGHNTLKLIQSVCDSWTDKQITASFTSGKIGLKFGSEDDISSNLDVLLSLIDEVKPAHLPYVLRYLLSQKNKFYIGTSMTEIIKSEFNCRNSL